MKQHRSLVFVLWLLIILLLFIQGCSPDKNRIITSHLPAGTTDATDTADTTGMSIGTTAYTGVRDTKTPEAVYHSAIDTGKLQEEKVLTLLKEAFTRTVFFEVSSPQLDYSTKIIRGDRIYYPVIDKNFPKSFTELRKYLEKAYTPRISDILLRTGKYIEERGKLYSYGGEMGTLKNYSRSRIELLSQTGSPQSVSRLYKIEVPNGINETTGEINYTEEKAAFKYVPGSGWRVNTKLSP